MSMYAEYLAERTQDLIIETGDGFATYRYIPDRNAVYLIDIYVVPKARKAGEASRLADRVAAEGKEKWGVKRMLGSVLVGKAWTTTNTKILLAYGFAIESATPEVIVFVKEVA